MRIAHLTTVDMSLRYLVLPQLEAAARIGESYGLSAPGPHVAELEKRGIVHVPLPASTRGMNLIGDIRAMRQFWRVLRQIKPDVVHTHNPKPGVYGRILSRLAGVPIVVNTVHGLYATPESLWLKRVLVYSLEAVAARFSDAELVQNPEDLDLLERLRIVPASKLRLLGNGVDLSRFNPERTAAVRSAERRRLGVGESEVLVGMVGRLVSEKGIPELIESAGRLGPRIRVVVAGPDDPEKDDAVTPELLEQGRNAGVEFIGMRSDIDAFYAALDVFVLPSHREGFPRAAMEAAASGLPLVLTDIRGCRQVVDDGVNGRLVPVNDPVALTAAITELASSPKSRETMGAASAAKARAEFDEGRVVDLVMRTYADVASAKGLSWKLPAPDASPVAVRRAVPGDERAISSLHSEMIETGFLSSLGSGFLTLLYRSIITDPRGLVFVAERDARVVGFVAGTTDTGAVYRRFVKHNLVGAILRLAPVLLRPWTWRLLLETLRYGSSGQVVPAELLSMAIAPSARRKGLGGRLVNALLEESDGRGLGEMKVVVGAGNDPAIRLYGSCGFGEPRSMEVHRGEPSVEMTWRS